MKVLQPPLVLFKIFAQSPNQIFVADRFQQLAGVACSQHRAQCYAIRFVFTFDIARCPSVFVFQKPVAYRIKPAVAISGYLGQFKVLFRTCAIFAGVISIGIGSGKLCGQSQTIEVAERAVLLDHETVQKINGWLFVALMFFAEDVRVRERVRGRRVAGVTTAPNPDAVPAKFRQFTQICYGAMLVRAANGKQVGCEPDLLFGGRMQVWRVYHRHRVYSFVFKWDLFVWPFATGPYGVVAPVPRCKRWWHVLVVFFVPLVAVTATQVLVHVVRLFGGTICGPVPPRQESTKDNGRTILPGLAVHSERHWLQLASGKVFFNLLSREN